MKNSFLKHSYANRVIALAFLTALTVHAQDVQPLVHVLELKSLAEQREEECKIKDAADLYKAARESVRNSHSMNSVASGANGFTEAEIDERLAKLAKRGQEIANESHNASELLKRGQAESAFKSWQAYNGPACDPGLGSQIEEARRQSAALISNGDNEPDVRRKFRLYLDAFHLDNQVEGLYGRMSSAHEQVDKLPCNGCRVASKTVKTVVILGGIGAGAYFGWREYQHYEKAHSTACGAGTPCQ